MASVLLLSMFSQCQEKKASFYKDSMLERDVWRLPIVKPYELITAYCCTGWTFQQLGVSTSFSADSINLYGNYIIFSDSGHMYGAFDIEQRKTLMFSDYKKFIDFTKLKKIPHRIYQVEMVYDCWRNTGQLPWAKEIIHSEGYE